jgi:hypothetical protein
MPAEVSKTDAMVESGDDASLGISKIETWNSFRRKRVLT